ncbi:RINT-1 family protein [Xylona heveae TC161]|uniref:RINT-1 family protein n=1 Tax=Xylona heveae (strain CBS 132557 / TC161) TaxID=1328760 RepID=A0A165I8Y5_XYLHT|nr:RINT-1 family protein [Xylona heveae TC161]KZF24559.1 RINT-1 family protein [Xylona heveae TC161]
MDDVAFSNGSLSRLGEDQRVRVEDYLNDKLQNTADLESLDSLIQAVKDQQALLKKQLQEAEDALRTADQESAAHASSLAHRATLFQQNQADIDRRLMIVTHSETSDDAVRRFGETMEKLRRLDLASGYTELLQEVEALSAETRNQLKESPEAALAPYTRLQSLIMSLYPLHAAAESAAPHLLDHVERIGRTLKGEMKDHFSKKFGELLQKLNWPDRGVTVPEYLAETWKGRIDNLLNFQQPELEAQENQPARRFKQPPVLLPFEVMAKPLELRFRYHFDGDKPTNRLDKPEYFLTHILGLVNTYYEFLMQSLEPILRAHFKGSNLALNPLYIDATSAFITSILPILRSKIHTFLPQIARQPQLLSHFMHELMSFDASLRDEWGYDAGAGAEGWKGLTWEVLVQEDWFGRWLQVEKDFALSRYHNILETADSGEIDYDSVDPGITKPTKAAIRVNDLLETITDRYRPLLSFSQKLRFLIDIQIAIFDKLHERLHSSLEAYLTLTSSIGRTVQGVTREDQTKLQGLGGLERLCRVYGSAEYLEKAMGDWSDDVFFLELWEELQDRARQSTGKNLAGPMSIKDVAERTSSAVGSEGDTGALFDETAGAYHRLRVRAENILIDTMTYNVREALRPYGRVNPWSSLSSESDSAASAITPEIEPVIQLLSTQLSFLANILAPAPLRRVSRHVCLSIQSYLWDHVLFRNSFSTTGVAQLARDVAAIWAVIDRSLVHGDRSVSAESSMRKLKDAIALLSVPLRNSSTARSTSTPRAQDDEDDRAAAAWGEDDEAGAQAEEKPDMRSVSNAGADEEGEVPYLEDVEKRVFQSNESAREALHLLGLEHLSESDARYLLERRLELSG